MATTTHDLQEATDLLIDALADRSTLEDRKVATQTLLDDLDQLPAKPWSVISSPRKPDEPATFVWIGRSRNADDGRYVTMGPDGRPVLTQEQPDARGTGGAKTPVSGLRFNVHTKQWEGDNEDTYRTPAPRQPKQRRSAAAVVVEQILDATKKSDR